MIPMRVIHCLFEKVIRLAEQDYYPSIRDYWTTALSTDLGNEYLVAFRHVIEAPNMGSGIEQIANYWIDSHLADPQTLNPLVREARLLRFLQVDVFGIIALASNPGKFCVLVIEVKDNQLTLSDFGQTLVYILGSNARFGFLLGVNVDTMPALSALLAYRPSIMNGKVSVNNTHQDYNLGICKWDTSSGDPLRFQVGQIDSIHMLSRFIKRELSVS